jgi:D-alanyl-D-alanine carboxypeptidase/D-alanyl-D-alanine-endopeptidase (penicillin-binding protein 4)
MKSFLFSFLSALVACGAFGQEPAKAPQSLEALQQRINELINQPQYNAAFWGVKIASLDSGKILFEHNAQKLFSPASNSKLYTMALALDHLGVDYRIKTSLYAQSRPDETGALNGDLIVYGRGDPTISGEYNGGDVLKALEPLVAVLTNAGVKQITGDLIGDDSYFHGPPFGSGWDWGDLENEYGAEISALTINSNTVQLAVKPGDAIGAPAQLAFSPDTTYLTVINRTQTTAKGTPRRVNLYRPVAENTVYVTGEIPLESPPSSEDMTMHDPAGWFVALSNEPCAVCRQR